MITYSMFLKRLKNVKAQKYVRTHRSGPTGIGKTIEDFLGVKENNAPGPDGHRIELKSKRKNASSMITLFTKSPLPPKINSVLVNRFGYTTNESRGKKVLHSTINAIDYNSLRGKSGFKARILGDRIEILYKGKMICYWDRNTLKEAFERKLPRLFYIVADSRGEGADEEFWFSEAWLLSGFSFTNFTRLLKKNKIKIDVRIGQNPDGSGHDHGTGFRVFEPDFELCFANRKRVV